MTVSIAGYKMGHRSNSGILAFISRQFWQGNAWNRWGLESELQASPG